jgi:secreted trypsin-like serine protease
LLKAARMRNQLSFVLFVSGLVSSAAFAGSPDHPVVGGSTVATGAYPDVALVVAPMALCSGTLIAPDVVLTAGHCIDTHPTEVLLGSVDYTKVGGEAIAVKSATAYPSWQTEFDVGVLVLDHPASAKPRAIASACTAKDLEPGNDVTVVGFGLTDAAGMGQNTKLHQAKLAVIDPACTTDLACNPKIAPAGEFVAGGDGIDACFGDSGGPIYLDDALIGVVSRASARAPSRAAAAASTCARTGSCRGSSRRPSARSRVRRVMPRPTIRVRPILPTRSIPVAARRRPVRQDGSHSRSSSERR